MPELPEVETIAQGIRPFVQGQCVRKVNIRQRQLRWQVPHQIKDLVNQQIKEVIRRGKYLLLTTKKGTAIIHFGMSGSFSILADDRPPEKHDHFDIVFDDFCLRFTDPRRFGALLWTTSNPLCHPNLVHLGLEPFDKAFTGDYLFKLATKRKIPVKQFIMNNHVVVGVGNIYAAEALFKAKLHPLRPANEITLTEYRKLVTCIKTVLKAAIKAGGTTLRNYMDSSGKPGYFKQRLEVYGREGLSCTSCKGLLENIRLQNRATVYCPRCQR